MSAQFEKMKFIDYIKPVLVSGKHTVKVTQNVTVTKPQTDSFEETEDFYVSGRAYTFDINNVFNVSPTENECGDFSKLLPFITIENKTFPWERNITGDINGKPVPWVALIVISSEEVCAEKDITISELLNTPRDEIYFPKTDQLPPVTTEKSEDICHIVDMPRNLYESVMPSLEDLPYLTHARRINLFDTEDEISAKEGTFSVVIANRFIPTGDKGKLKSTVHLVSLIGLAESIPAKYNTIRLVSLYRWNIYSAKDDSKAFDILIDSLSKNTGVIGYDFDNDILKRCYVPKKHITRTGETTYSLYRSPLIPYANKEIDTSSKYTADGHLIYDPDIGIMDTSYAAAFQLGRLISLSRRIDGKKIAEWRKNKRIKNHKNLLNRNIKRVDVAGICKEMVKKM